MKKLNILAIIAVIATALSLNSCDGNGTGTTDTPDAPKVSLLSDPMCYGNFFSLYTDLLHFRFVTDGISLKDSTYVGNGLLIDIDMLADIDKKAPKTIYPAPGDYKIAYDAFLGKDSTFVPEYLENGILLPPMSDSQNRFGCFVYTVENDQATKVQVITDGSVISVSGDASKSKIILKLKLLNQDRTIEDATYIYQGTTKFDTSLLQDGSDAFAAEADAPKGEFKMTRMNGNKKGDLYDTGIDTYSITLYGDNKEIAHFNYHVAAGKKPLGTFTIGQKFADGQAECAYGHDENGKYMGAYIGTEGPGGKLDKVWYPVSGTITVENEKITFNVKTHKGHTITGTYDDLVTF